MIVGETIHPMVRAWNQFGEDCMLVIDDVRASFTDSSHYKPSNQSTLSSFLREPTRDRQRMATCLLVQFCTLLVIAMLAPSDGQMYRAGGDSSLCLLCASDTFACGSRMVSDSTTSNLSRVDHQNNPTIRLEQVLLKLNHQRQYASSNCTCIPQTWRCDGEPDCADSSDEMGCDRIACSTSEEFSCFTQAKCIPKSQFCNGKDECGDNSDEIDCSSRECDMEHETRCDNGRCIPSEWLCDQHDDCGDLSDERCVHPCSPGEFQCHSGGCVPIARQCDGEAHCEDHSDEIHCSSTPWPSSHLSSIEGSHISCPANHFMCNNGLCISQLYQCDSDNDCGDWSDEEGCDGRAKCRITEFQCKSGQCINQDWQCDGDFDCDDHSDEFACVASLCLQDEFRCRSGRCIRASWRCDGDFDCDDNSDEEGCAQRTECTSGNFRCRDGTCIHLSNVCDGAPNCPDGSDEDTNSTCLANVVPCRENGLPCQHLCMATTSGHYCVCKEGYRKGSDGYSCIDIDECQIGNLRSEYKFSLSSEIHYKSSALPNIQVCSQKCHNSVPGFQCSCVTGYRLRVDKRRCKAIITPEAIFLASNFNDVRGFVLDSSQLTAAVMTRPNTGNQSSFEDTLQMHHVTQSELNEGIVSTDFHYKKNLIFWTSPKTKQIYSALIELNPKSLLLGLANSNPRLPLQLSRLKLHNTKPIIESGLIEPSGLAVDWANHRLYWADFATSRIEYANLDGSTRKILFSRSVQKPKSIVIHPELRTIYWSDWGEPARIERAFLDGSGRQVILSSLLTTPSSLLIDYPSDKLFWVDVRQSMIECVNLDGSARYTILQDSRFYPISLTIFEDYLYWSSYGSSNLNLINKLTGQNATFFTVKKEKSHDETMLNLEVKIYHSLRQPEVEHNPCQSSLCSHICLPNNISYQCSCPFGFTFEDASHHLCHKKASSQLLFTRRNDIRTLVISKDKLSNEADIHFNDYNLDHVLPISNLAFVVSLDYDSVTSTIYWSDLMNKSICRAHWSGAKHECMVSTSLEAPSGIAYDWVGQNLYWTDTARNLIEVSKVNGSFRSLVVWRSLNQPRDIVVDPLNSLMFWSQWSNQSANIERAGMDGSYRIILHSVNMSKPQGLAIDAASKLLFWTDLSQSHIEFSHYDGSNRRSLVSRNTGHPFAITVDRNYVYWTDVQQRNIQSAHRVNGEHTTILLEDIDNPMDVVLARPNDSDTHIEDAACGLHSRCSHLCLLSPLPAGYKCLCPTGIPLLPDGFSCADDMGKYLILTTRNAIKRISLETDYHIDVTLSLDRKLINAFILDVHINTNTVFWSDTSENLIYKANMHNGNIEPVVRFGLTGVNGLAVDNVGDSIYWTDAARRKIEVARLDGSQRKVLISRELDSPRAIALHSSTGHMVWVDWGEQVRIERADMDGQRRAVLVKENLGWPNGITITKHARIIWADSKTHSIEMVDLNGANRRKIAENLSSPYGVTVIDDFLYWTDWNTKSISRIYLSSEFPQIVESKIEVIIKSLHNIVDVRAIDKLASPYLHGLPQNMCQVNNGGCSHLCLRNSAPGYSCHCPTGMSLLSDRRTCNPKMSKQLLIACKTNLRRISLDSPDLTDMYLPISNLVDVTSIDFHYALGQVFYVDSTLKQIRSLTLVHANLSRMAELDLYTVRTVVSTELVMPNSVAVDWIANNLYWTDQGRRLIEVARLDGSSRKVLIDLGLDHPKCLVILPNHGFIFWINSGKNSKIERAFSDGSGRITLVSEAVGQLNGLTVASESGNEDSMVPLDHARLYWTDGMLQRIESCNLDGTGRHTLISQQLTLPFSITILDDYVYWTDLYNKVIERANRWTGSNLELIVDNIDSVQEIKTIGQQQQRVARHENLCAQMNGACSHLCLFRPHGYICACPSFPDTRPCSTVPGEISGNVLLTNQTQDKKFDYQNKAIFNTSILVTTTPTQLFESDDLSNHNPVNYPKLNQTISHNSLCPNNIFTSRCNSTNFIIDDHIVRATYAIALVLLSLLVLICAILTFICKRKLINEELKYVNKSNHNSHLKSKSEMSPETKPGKVITTSSLRSELDNQLVVPPAPPPPRRLLPPNHLRYPSTLSLVPPKIPQFNSPKRAFSHRSVTELFEYDTLHKCIAPDIYRIPNRFTQISSHDIHPTTLQSYSHLNIRN